MAEGNVEVSVSVEAVLHRELRELLQRIANEHGLRVDSVDCDWITQVGGKHTLVATRLRTSVGT